MLYRHAQSTKSLLDFLLEILPNNPENGSKFHIIELRPRKPSVNNKAAKILFSIWKDESNTINDKVLKRPENIATSDIDLLEKENLAEYEDGKIKITDKGSEIIKTMILGDDKSIFEDHGEIMDIHTAIANTKPKTANKKGGKFASGNWYKKAKND